MKFIAYSDPHIHPHQSYSKALPDGMNTRLKDALDAVSEIYEIAGKLGLPVVSGGDTFQIKNSIPVLAYTKMAEILKARSDFIVASRTDRLHHQDVMCIGNHDMATHDGRCHALAPFRGLEGIEIPYQDCNHYINWVGESSKTLISVIPYPMHHGKFNQDKFRQHIECADKVIAEIAPDTSILLSHLFTHELMKKHLGLDGEFSGLALLEHFDMVLLGHHHTHDIIEGPKDKRGRTKKVVSIGSPLQLKSSERGEKKGYLIVDTDTLGVEFHPLESPEFRAFDSLEALSIASDKGTKGHFVTIRVKSKAEAAKAEWIMAKAEPACYRIEIVPEAKALRIDLAPGAKDEEILGQYIGSDWGKTELDLNQLKKVGLSYLALK